MNNEVLKIKRGDYFCFEMAYKQFQKGVYCFVLKKSKSEYLAEETVQETFVKLWKEREKLNENISLSSQIFQIAKTTFIDLLRKESNFKKLKSWYGNNNHIIENTTDKKFRIDTTQQRFKINS